jgi:hypothetical protein
MARDGRALEFCSGFLRQLQARRCPAPSLLSAAVALRYCRAGPMNLSTLHEFHAFQGLVAVGGAISIQPSFIPDGCCNLVFLVRLTSKTPRKVVSIHRGHILFPSGLTSPSSIERLSNRHQISISPCCQTLSSRPDCAFQAFFGGPFSKSHCLAVLLSVNSWLECVRNIRAEQHGGLSAREASHITSTAVRQPLTQQRRLKQKEEHQHHRSL